jgi:ABC-type multidrug transport system ATPase subunit/surface polysaccharide O-acyltransferase-like enzyme
MRTERLYAMDAVRAFALLSGVVLHAAMSFMPGLAAFGFPADSSPSTFLQNVFYVIHVFRMPLFFFIAGYFGHLMFHRKGTAGFARDRVKRILLPLLVGWAAFGPMTMGLIYMHLAPMQGSPAAPPPQSGLPLSHLWFLYYLLLVYLGVIGLRALALNYVPQVSPLRNWVDTAVKKAVENHTAAILVAAPIVLCFFFTPNWMMWLGVPTPDTGLMPRRPALVAYGTAFLFGWIIHRQSDLLGVFARRWAFHLIAAIALTSVSLFLVGKAPNPFAVPASIKLAYAASYTLAAWNWVFAFVGIGLQFFSRERAIIRYVSDSSYWVYLAHLPIVFALQLIVMKWPVHWSIKFPFIVCTALAVLLLSYHFVVRNTVIGQVLNGRRHSSKRLSLAAHADSTLTSHAGQFVAELRDARKAFGGTQALDGFNMQVHRGEIIALLGPNGAGKTTAISLLLGLEEIDSGAVSLFARDLQSDPDHLLHARGRIGVMLQEITLPAEMRVAELIELTSSYYAAPLPLSRVLEMTHTTGLAKRRYGDLSGGQQRLTQFAMAVCGRPQLLFLDEPTTGLDLEARETLWATVRQLVQEGCSVILTTHYLEEAEALADRVVVIGKGHVLAEGTMDQIRTVVSSKRVSCITSISSDLIEQWPGVVSVSAHGRRTEITTDNAESIVRHLLANDPHLRELQVGQASLADAFVELTKEAA